VRACTANGKWQTALRVFDSAASLLPAGDGSADDSGAGGAAAGRGNSGWQLRGLWAAAVEACGEGGQWEKATELLARMDRAFLGGAAQPDAAELTTAPTNGGGGSGGGLDGFGGRLGGSESDEGQGEQLRERRRPPRFEGRAFAHAIKACERAGQWRRAVELLNKGRANGVLEYFGPASASSGVSSSGTSSSSRSEVRDGDEDEDVDGVDALPPILPYNMVLAALGRSGQWREALALLDELEAAADARAREKERRDAAQEALLAAVSASVSGAAAAGASGGEAPPVPAFQRPRPPAARLPLPDLVSYNSCVAACGRAGEWAAALRVLSRLKPRGVQPDKVLPRTQATET
jgi:pentatricopeptide repeat domain-containing protein 1